MTNDYEAVLLLKRPKLLIEAAKSGFDGYRRHNMLAKLTKSEQSMSNQMAVRRLLPLEERFEIARVTGDSSYSPARHVELFIALLAEMCAGLGAKRETLR